MKKHIKTLGQFAFEGFHQARHGAWGRDIGNKMWNMLEQAERQGRTGESD